MALRVKVSFGRTINLGNFESFRADVGLESDKRDGETIDAAFRRVADEAEKQLKIVCSPVEKALDEADGRRKTK